MRDRGGGGGGGAEGGGGWAEKRGGGGGRAICVRAAGRPPQNLDSCQWRMHARQGPFTAHPHATTCNNQQPLQRPVHASSGWANPRHVCRGLRRCGRPVCAPRREQAPLPPQSHAPPPPPTPTPCSFTERSVPFKPVTATATLPWPTHQAARVQSDAQA